MVTLRHARLDEREKTYQWLCLSDITPLAMGAPDYPESPVPTREQFLEDFDEFYYTESGREAGSVLIIENNGEEIGCLCYTCFHLRPGRAELDIWLKEKRYCGRGLGSEALRVLVKYLESERNIHKFLIRPSVRNIRAIRAYEKAGFRHAADPGATVDEYLTEKYKRLYGDGDYGFENTAVLTQEEMDNK